MSCPGVEWEVGQVSKLFRGKAEGWELCFPPKHTGVFSYIPHIQIPSAVPRSITIQDKVVRRRSRSTVLGPGQGDRERARVCETLNFCEKG